MASSIHQQTETVQAEGNDDTWIFLQHDGNAYPKCGKNVFGWFRFAWNDAFVRNALWEDKRLYVLIAALSLNTVLLVLAALASLTECNALHALLICLKHFTTMTQNAAFLSMTTRFLSLTAVKASVLDKSRDAGILCFLIITNVVILRVAGITSTGEVNAGITVFEEVRREENFEWFLQPLAEMARVLAFTAASALSAFLLFLMMIDAKVTLAAASLHWRIMMEYTKLAASRRLKGPDDRKPSFGLMIAALIVQRWNAPTGCRKARVPEFL
ncbi:hypothetical protein MTO96_017028 [Rhipicephalus appendiculatus]